MNIQELAQKAGCPEGFIKNALAGGEMKWILTLVELAKKSALPEWMERRNTLNVELGYVAMKFVDRAGDIHPGIDDAETICAEFYEAMNKVIEQYMPINVSGFGKIVGTYGKVESWPEL